MAPVGRNVLKGLRLGARPGPCDLVLAGGLFDYLPDAVAVSLLRYAHDRLLAPSGAWSSPTSPRTTRTGCGSSAWGTGASSTIPSRMSAGWRQAGSRRPRRT
ncbi:MAG: hypothetical protein R2712_30945 [Vicinamibacterales bacterium]